MQLETEKQNRELDLLMDKLDPNNKPRKFEVWMEGFSATGDYCLAQKLGECEATTFEEACCKVIESRGMNTSDWNVKNLTFWGCKLYDNEVDARGFFG